MKSPALIVLVLLALVGAGLGLYFLAGRPDPPKLTIAKAARHEIRVMVSTNGIIEPLNRTDVYAPIDGFVTSIQKREGAEILQGRLLLQLNSDQIRAALAEANASLLAAQRQARVVEIGPSREEVSAIDASIDETAVQLNQVKRDLAVEESLLAKQATSGFAVQKIQNERDQLEIRLQGFRQRKLDLQARYSEEDRKAEQGRVAELTKQVGSLQRQLLGESVVAPKSGLIYSLQVRQGSYVSKGQLLAQIYTPGKTMLRAYVDEPDLGRIRKGQPVRIEWDGLPNEHWTGLVERMAEQVVAMNNRSVGEVLCSIENGPGGLIPNLNVRVEITTGIKNNALMVPRSAVFNPDGKPAVILSTTTGIIMKHVDLGLNTPEEIEILNGINEGESVVLNPVDVAGK